MPVLDRFLRYVTFDTRADESLDNRARPRRDSSCCCDLLAGELRELGLTDVERDANGYLFATIPATPASPLQPSGFSRTSTRRPR